LFSLGEINLTFDSPNVFLRFYQGKKTFRKLISLPDEISLSKFHRKSWNNCKTRQGKKTFQACRSVDSAILFQNAH
jgi:hypothetical protein